MSPMGNPKSCTARSSKAPMAVKRETPSPGKAVRTVPQLQDDVSQAVIYMMGAFVESEKIFYI